ncbi:MAG: thrombospondin type 3 repeat-containing protein [Chloroflexota bacterium]|nr:thrombospondin type 3 repeat-containing protein [Chloroflexota bacterium]
MSTPRPFHVHRLSLLPLALVLVLAMISPATGSRLVVEQIEDDILLATVTVQLADGEMSWRAENASTIAESDAAVQFEPGFVAALDEPLLLLFEAGARLERVPADAAFAVSEPLEGHPVALLADAPVPYLGIELREFDGGTADPESMPFAVAAGEYELTLWRLDPALPLTLEYIDRLGALDLPMLAYVREGAVDVPSTTGGEPERLEAGAWTVIDPGVTLTPVEGQAPPILLLATLDQPGAEATGGPAVSQPQGGGTTRRPTTRPTTTEATEAPVVLPVVPETETPAPAVIPTTIPTEVPGQGTGNGGFDPGPGDVEQDCEDFFADSDGDGITDECEIERGTDPNVPNSGDTGGEGSVLFPPDVETEQIEDPNMATVESGNSGIQSQMFEEGPILSRSNGPGANDAESAVSVIDEVSLACDATVADSDGDGLVDACEAEYGTDPAKADSDGDTLTDGDEVYTHESDPMRTDSDGDGLPDGDEVTIHHTSPALADSDGDGLDDGNEVNTYRTNPAKADSDGDGLDDGAEVGAGLDPLDSDFDDDGLNDGDEVNTYGTYPKVADSDDDGLLDGDEITYGSGPFVADTDGDCLPDGYEVFNGTNPTMPDLDKDGNNMCTFDTDLG